MNTIIFSMSVLLGIALSLVTLGILARIIIRVYFVEKRTHLRTMMKDAYEQHAYEQHFEPEPEPEPEPQHERK